MAKEKKQRKKSVPLASGLLWHLGDNPFCILPMAGLLDIERAQTVKEIWLYPTISFHPTENVPIIRARSELDGHWYDFFPFSRFALHIRRADPAIGLMPNDVEWKKLAYAAVTSAFNFSAAMQRTAYHYESFWRTLAGLGEIANEPDSPIVEVMRQQASAEAVCAEIEAYDRSRSSLVRVRRMEVITATSSMTYGELVEALMVLRRNYEHAKHTQAEEQHRGITQRVYAIDGEHSILSRKHNGQLFLDCAVTLRIVGEATPMAKYLSDQYATLAEEAFN